MSPAIQALGDALLQPLAAPGGSPITGLEILACVLSVWMVVCNARVNPLGWPLAIASSALYAWLFAHSKLYGEAALQGVFIAVGLWGWWQWLRGTGDDGAPLVVRRLDRNRLLKVAAVTLAAWPVLALVLSRATDSDVPWLDALPTVGSLAGTWLLARKWLENWPTWVAVNLVSIALFAVKGLWLTVGLYAVFAVMALWGWRAWASLARQRPHAA